MVIGRVLRSSGCASCRFSLLKSFASVASPSLRLPQTSSRLPLRPSLRQNRFYSSLETRQQDDVEDNEEELELFEDEENDELDVPEGGTVNTEVSAMPWYLQEKAPQTEIKPLSERQRIPDLPEHPPPILQPLFQQISIDLGLDDLSLIDLRKLNPPPALGANLIMIIGTARSERHLHVSADRLCRWLRSNYKLRPNADGLLGRNELKLKLRRKAKRAKLTGGASDETGDDGIRTGWVCVDAGVVESAEGEKEVVPEKKAFVGFGRQTDGVRMVVQMFTEEKREEMELERLWGGLLKRSIKQQSENAEDSAIEPPTDAKADTHSGAIELPTEDAGVQAQSGAIESPAGDASPQARPELESGSASVEGRTGKSFFYKPRGFHKSFHTSTRSVPEPPAPKDRGSFTTAFTRISEQQRSQTTSGLIEWDNQL